MDRKYIAGLVAISAVLVAIRMVLITLQPDFKFPDEKVYLDIATQVAAESRYEARSGLVTHAIRQAPGLPVTLGLLGKVVPLSPRMAKTVNGMVFVLAAVVYAMAAWLLTRRKLAVVLLLLLVGLHPPLLYLSTTNYPQTFQTLWTAALVLAWAYRWQNDKAAPRNGIFDGAVIGLGALFVPTQVFLAPSALVFHWRRGYAWMLGYVVWAALGGILVLSPWIVRNWVVEHAFIPFSTNGGEQCFLGFNSAAAMNTGNQIVPPNDVQQALQGAASAKEVEAVYKAAARKWVMEHPVVAVRLWGLKMVNFFRWDNGKMVTEGERSAMREWVARLTTLSVFAIALLGAWKGRVPLSPWPMATIVLMVGLAAGHAFFISRYRYRLPFEPLLLFVGVVGLFGLAREGSAVGRGACHE